MREHVVAEHPVGIRVRQLELTAVLVLEVEGVQVREERYRDSDTTGQPLCRGNEHDPIQWARDRPKLIVQEKNNKIYSVFKRTTADSYPFLWPAARRGDAVCLPAGLRCNSETSCRSASNQSPISRP